MHTVSKGKTLKIRVRTSHLGALAGALKALTLAEEAHDDAAGRVGDELAALDDAHELERENNVLAGGDAELGGAADSVVGARRELNALADLEEVHHKAPRARHGGLADHKVVLGDLVHGGAVREAHRVAHNGLGAALRRAVAAAGRKNLAENAAIAGQIRRALEAKELDLKLERRAAGDLWRGAVLAVRIVVAALENALFADAHGRNADVPALDHAAGAQLKVKGRAAVAARVKHAAVRQATDIVNKHLVAVLGTGRALRWRHQNLLRNTAVLADLNPLVRHDLSLEYPSQKQKQTGSKRKQIEGMFAVCHDF